MKIERLMEQIETDQGFERFLKIILIGSVIIIILLFNNVFATTTEEFISATSTENGTTTEEKGFEEEPAGKDEKNGIEEMGLLGGGSCNYEDLSTYEKVDSNNRFTVATNKITVSGMKANEDAYIYYDFGADYFDDIELYFEIYVNDSLADWSRSILGFSNKLDDFNNWDSGFGVMGEKHGSGEKKMKIRVDRYGWLTDNISDDLEYETVYYLKVLRASANDSVYVYIYSNSARTNLIDSIAVSGLGTSKYRYFYAITSTNQAIDGRAFSGYVEKISFCEIIEEPVAIEFAYIDEFNLTILYFIAFMIMMMAITLFTKRKNVV